MKKDVDENWKINLYECQCLQDFIDTMAEKYKKTQDPDQKYALSILISNARYEIEMLTKDMPKEYLRKI